MSCSENNHQIKEGKRNTFESNTFLKVYLFICRLNILVSNWLYIQYKNNNAILNIKLFIYIHESIYIMVVRLTI